jgi:hypothetical protein
LIETLLSIVKVTDGPGSIDFLLLCIAIGLILLFVWPRRRRPAAIWTAGVLTVYAILALPLTARAIAAGLPRADVRGLAPGTRIDTLVIFDGDNRRGRIHSAARVYAESRPDSVWVLGIEAKWYEPELLQVGIPGPALHFDVQTLNTRDQVAWIGRQATSKPDRRMAIIASRLQTPRIAGMLSHAGLSGVPLVEAPIDAEPPVAGGALVLPSYVALRVSRDAIYEHLALAYYRHNGWVPR